MRNLAIVFLIMSLFAGCAGKTSSSGGGKAEEFPDSIAVDRAICFNGDSALAYVEAQCAFGARVPNSDAHRRCGEYLASTLRRHGAIVTEQTMQLTAFDGTILNAKNIIGSFNPNSENRIMLLAHWDSRPWADAEKDAAKRRMPVMGANDAASGTGVLLEMARILGNRRPGVGIDIMLVDCEDWGDSGDDNSWALGTQYWCNNKHEEGYTAMFGILLDMVGAPDARFYKEYYSMGYAPSYVNKLWQCASRLGYSKYFVKRPGGAVTDDHLFVNEAGIPCVDIIDTRDSDNGFFPYWHTTSDTPDRISAQTLEAVGRTVAAMVYSY